MTALSDYLNEVARKHDIIGPRPFSEAAGISKSAADRYLDGTRVPTRDMMRKMANNLNRRYGNAVKYERMLELAGMARDEIPFEVPKEFNRLTKQQRRALLRVGWLFLDVSEPDDASPDQPSLNSQGAADARDSSRRVTESVLYGGE